MIVLVPRSAGSGAILSPNSCSDTCLLAFLAFLALPVLWTLHSRPISISILPFPLPSGPTSLPFALQNSVPVYLLLARALMSLYAPSLLFSSFLPSPVLSRYHLSSIYPHEGLFSSLFITIKQDSSPYPYLTTLTNLSHHTPQPPAPLITYATLRYIA